MKHRLINDIFGEQEVHETFLSSCITYWNEIRTRRQHRKIVENEIEDLTMLVDTALGDSVMRSQLLAIVSLDHSHREFLIETIVANLRLKSAPEKLIHALDCLRDPGLASKAKELLLYGTTGT